MSTMSTKDAALIEKFLSQSLSKEEKILFSERNKEETFKIMLEEVVIKKQGRQQLKEKLRHIGSLESRKRLPNSRRKIYKTLITAAAIAIILFGINNLMINNSSITGEQVFNEYFEAYPNLNSLKGDEKNQDSSINEAFELYELEDFHKAKDVFEKIKMKRRLSSIEHFYFGISLLAIGEVEQSKDQFNKVSTSHPLYSETQWYYGLALIKQDSIDKAIQVLVQSQNSNKEKTKKLLNRIRK